MRFTFALLSLVAAAIAQDSSKPNSFNIPQPNYSLTAGKSQQFSWSNPSQGTITILLRTGANSDLQTFATLAKNIQNTGSFTYDVPSTIPEGANYALEIIDDQDNSITNFTPQFVISSPVKAVATSGGTTSLLTATSAGTAATSASAASTGSITSMASSASATSASNGTTMSTKASGTSGSSASGASSTGSSASKTSGAAASSGTPPSTGAAAQGAKAASGLVALAFGVVMVL